MLPILQLGPLAIQTHGLILLLGLWLGLSLAERWLAKPILTAGALYNLVLIAFLTGLIAARLAYVAMVPSTFLENPLNLLSPNPGLFEPRVGIAAGLIAALVYGNRKRLPFWATLDALTPFFAVFAMAWHLADLASGDAFGSPTALPWGIDLWGAHRHPTQLYEALAAILILWVIWIVPVKITDKSGTLWLTFIASSALARLAFEAFRGDSALLFGGLRAAQVAAWLILAASLWGLGRLRLIPKEAL